MAKPTVQPGANESCAETPCPETPGFEVPNEEPESAQTTKAKKSNRPWRPVFLAILAETSNVTAAAAAAEVPASRAYKDKRDDSEFAARWREALCEGYDLLEIEVLHRLRFGESKDGAKFDNATALRLLSRHRETVARERAIRDNADVEAVRQSLHAKLLQIREEVQRQRQATAIDVSVHG
ncbi:hypothetical protein [Novosphingobium taihuense]|uniref:Transcriptional antiterminator Rof (Rho-off) n=1 Tax=Novosphingobium taihuense TaxID=260085 RepID=A0A7W7ESG0_9SPHN|nr:hypothetical protein [Novosphingobium taihuense]MBB4611761.1 transcriptional antiterminator Rof (Rho-off) [Novosphingobium taihuense]TWH88883.1 hypothetical protein IQ25_01009 [Novosphingobium taihuense]